jgi:hypothetical protein
VEVLEAAKYTDAVGRVRRFPEKKEFEDSLKKRVRRFPEKPET